MKFIVFGLGHFGKALAIRLTELGHEVIGIDNDMKKVEKFKDKITHTVCLNATDRDAVGSLPLKDANAVIVAIGEDEAASLMTTAVLKQFDIKRILTRAVSDLQKTVLEAMKIDEFIMPEEESAERLAVRLVNLNVVDSFKISDNYSIIEAKVPEKYVGKTLAEANFTNEYKVIVLTTIKTNEVESKGIKKTIKEASGIATSGTRMEADDLLVIFGEMENINKLID
ncbi:potassium channel family protein [Albibacterium bauzanense]|uniref:Trk system potassium uptake protein TrkA n=1 Tax=Albibacterium bauzanense TaxID=653929 RepID=A0A4R1M3H6_9SPHI|nr:TrkA family potassium uptake protein [Albibacterium bauzanense]TCK85792.1 trk system potassium uptake protein TrkA [Albibacterium bauzanense]